MAKKNSQKQVTIASKMKGGETNAPPARQGWWFW
jgi:hypothetical protein